MLKFEDFKNNIEVIDEFDINRVNVNKNVVFSGHHKLFTYKDTNEVKSQPLAAAVLGPNNTGIPLPKDLDFHNCWTDVDAQEAYLKVKPKTFLILGKQGTGSYSLGESLSKKINCIHLCPKNVLLDELDQKSSTGKCLDFNMRHNKVCKFNTIWSIMKSKLKSPAVQHRGFVISGLPLVTSSQDKQYTYGTLHGEESLMIAEWILIDLICNLKKKKPRKKKNSEQSSVSSNSEAPDEGEVEEEEEPEPDLEDEEKEEQIVELPKFLLESCSKIIFPSKLYYSTKKSVLLHQVSILFDFKPDIIIYISCPNADAITKRSRKYLNYISSSNIFSPFTSKEDNEMRWPSSYAVSEYKKPFDIHVINPKYNCAQPIHLKKNATEQVCNFKLNVSRFLDEKLKEFDPRFIIKVDGRNSIHEMINHTMEILQFLPIKPVLIPEPLYLEEPLDDIDEFWSKVEELNVIRSGNIKFNRYSSAWYNRCPVQLMRRQSVRGNPKFAVTFFKHIYLLSSLDAMVKFCRNPRKFLKLEYLEPTCRVIIIGTKSSGKTMVAKCLSWLFDAPIICYKTLLKNEALKKYNNYAKTILSEIIASIEDARFAHWQSIELERVSNLNTWFNTVSSTLSSYVKLLSTKLKDESLNQDTIFLGKFNSLRKQLLFLPIDNLQECADALKDKNLLKYAPASLTIEAMKPTIPVLGDEDVTEAITDYIKVNELQKEIEPTPEELVYEVINLIQTDLMYDEACEEQVYSKFIIDGFPSDPEYWGHLIDAKLLPDYTIALFENREVDTDLLQRYSEIETCVKKYQERYLLASDFLIKIKLLQDKSPESILLNIQIIIDEIIKEALDLVFVYEKTSNDVQHLTENIEKFREDWDIIKLKLDENFKSFTEVELEGKSDIDVLDEVLLKIRKSYCKPFVNNEEEPEINEDENQSPKEYLTYNDSKNFGEVNVYCPIAFYDYGVLREGKPELTASYDNKLYYFSNEECREILQNDLMKYLSFNKPFKNIPPLRICVIGSTGSGKTAISKILSKELGLIHVDFAEYLNNFLIPKHFKKVGWQYENSFIDSPIEDDDLVEFQMDEENLNILADLLSNEQELRRMISNYLERGSPLLPVIMQPLLKKLWFKSPFQNTGIIVDGYPKLSSDLDDMLNCFCIPDVILELEGSLDTAVNRLSPIKLNNWKLQLYEAKNKAKEKLEAERQEWRDFVMKSIVIKLIIDEILDSACPEPEEIPIANLSTQLSTIIDAHPSGSANVDANLFATYNEFIQENPEPIDQSQWEKAEDALEKINNRLENIFEIDDENIQNLKDIIEEQKIKLINVDSKRPMNKVVRKVFSKLSNFRNRSESFFEQTFVINCDIAEMLVSEGFFLLSKFNRMCPVYIAENPFTLFNFYNINKRKNKIFPVIHRAYIYFISSEECVKKFRKNPLKYIQNDTISHFKCFTLRIGVIGPPKSGKSKLAAKLAKKYGLICLTKGMAIRHVLDRMDWTVLGEKILTSLRTGEMIETELIMKAVWTVTMDYRTITNGFVLDGFPESPQEVYELSENGLFPHIMFDLNTGKETILRNSQFEIYYNILKWKPPYSCPFIENRYNKWNENCSRVRDWINNDTQNLYVINGNNSKWQCFVDAFNKIELIMEKVHYYLTYSKSKIVPLDAMCISKKTFQKRMSSYKNLCPICFNKNTLRHSGFPPYNKGLVQYDDCFYWICADHIKLVLQHPTLLLSPKKIIIPELPAIVKTVNISLLYENGVCIVTYAENLPSQRVIKGKNDFAATYKKNTYLFCCSECLNKFLLKPHMYFNIKVFKEINIFPKITLNKLPHLGYLEQTVGNIMTNACCAVNVLRPKYPGLCTKLSALIYIALYLKTHNSNSNAYLSMYNESFKIYEARCKLMHDIGLRLRSMDNPFAKYPICCYNRSKSTRKHSDTLHRSASVFSTSNSSLCIKSYSTELSHN